MSKVARSAAKWRLVTRLLGLPLYNKVTGAESELRPNEYGLELVY